MKYTVQILKEISYRTRRRFLELFTGLGYGHVTSAFSWTEIAVVLYYEILRQKKEDMLAGKADRLVVSKGHGCGILFPIFEDLGYFSKEEMETILQVGGDSSKLNRLFYPGFDFYGGSLGIGLPMAAGMAMGDKLSNRSCRTYCLVGDAECYEGSIWEGVHFAGHNCLGNLVVILDRNGLGVSDFTEHMLKLEPLALKWESCGWDVCEVDGHDVEDVYQAIHKAGSQEHLHPQCIIAHTKKGKGLTYLVDKPLMHGYMPKKADDIERAFVSLEH